MENQNSKSDEENTEVDEDVEVVVIEEGNEESEGQEEEEEAGKYLKDGEFNVEKILKMKIEKGKKMFWVKWDGYPSSQNTWEPIDHLSSIPAMVEEFEREYRKKGQTQAIKSGSTHLPESNRPKESKGLKRFATANLTNETITKKIKENPKNKALEEEYQAEESRNQSPIVEIVEEEEIIEAKSPSSKTNQRKVQKSQVKTIKEVPPKKVQAQKTKDKLGSFKQKDKPLCIKGVKPGKNGEFFFMVEWEKRNDGIKPENSHVSNKEFKVSDPDFLFEFYESKLVIFSRKKPQNGQGEQSPSNQSPVENTGKNNLQVLEEMTRAIDAHVTSGDEDFLNLNQNTFL